MFCDCLNNDEELTPNANVCPICLGHPGVLPKINSQAVDAVIKTGLALNCRINKFSKFDRKNYFYPDLPKGYQISQYDQPLCLEGFFVLPSGRKKIRIRRIHLEEDTAKLTHAIDGKGSLVDFNRAGVPLMELVTEPDLSSAEETVEFAEEFQLILRYLGVSDGDMEKGHLRVEVNISLQTEGADPKSENPLGTKVEIKNLNSFRAVSRSIEYEIKRQTEILESGKKVKQETRGWDGNREETFSQRSKEEAHDYRYFPEPDLPPLTFDDEYINKIKSEIAELPNQKRLRLSEEYNLPPAGVEILVRDINLADFFEEAVSELRSLDSERNVKILFDYLTTDVKGMEKERGTALSESGLKPLFLAQIVSFIQKGKISSRVAKDILFKSFDTGKSPEDILNEENLFQISDESEIEKAVDEIIDKNKEVCQDYREGKENALQFLIGKVMAKTQGKANPQAVRSIFRRKLSR